MTKSGIKIENYNPEWSSIFKGLKCVLEAELGDLLLSIEHIGSTSVNNLSAKPIIDLNLVIDNCDILPKVIRHLESLGYYHEGDLGIEGREAFGRKDHFTPWYGGRRVWMDHHLYVCCKGSKELARHLTFRDYLRDHPEAVREYGQLKKKLAETAKDRESYTEGKSGFVNRILEQEKH